MKNTPYDKKKNKEGRPYDLKTYHKFKSDEDKAKRAHREVSEEYSDEPV